MKVGLDLVHIPEIERVMRRRGRFRQRFFSDAEISWCESGANPFERYAARFAAKEAYVKATGYRGAWKLVEVVPGAGGAPILRVAGAEAAGDVSISLTHSGDYAAAVVVKA